MGVKLLHHRIWILDVFWMGPLGPLGPLEPGTKGAGCKTQLKSRISAILKKGARDCNLCFTRTRSGNSRWTLPGTWGSKRNERAEFKRILNHYYHYHIPLCFRKYTILQAWKTND